MSHFSVAVFTNGDDDFHEAVTRALAPFHEFETTGLDDEFVRTIDITEKTRAEYNDPQRTKSMVRLADGTLISAYDNSLWRELTDDEMIDFKSKGIFDDRELSDGRRVIQDMWGTEIYHPRVQNYPGGSEQIDVPVAEIMTFAEFVEYWHSYKVLDNYNSLVAPIPDDFKYGYVELDDDGKVVRVMDRTNPQAQWDWWVIGGRYSERLFVKDGTTGDRGKRSWGMEDKPDTGGLDTALLTDIDWDKMVADKIAERRRWFQQHHEGYELAIIAAHGDEEKIKAANDRADWEWGWDAATMKTEDDYVGVVKPLTAFAALYKGKWYQSGEMGWFGIVTDEKDPNAWDNEFLAILEDAKQQPNMRLTIVDCHI